MTFKESDSPIHPCFLKKKILEVVKAFRSSNRDTLMKHEVLIRWSLPSSNWCKLNTDGAVKKPQGIAGCGGVLRDKCGKWIVGFGANLGIATVNEAELWGLYDGLQVAWNSGHRCVMMEMDSKSCFTINITKDTKIPSIASSSGVPAIDKQRLGSKATTCFLRRK